MPFCLFSFFLDFANQVVRHFVIQCTACFHSNTRGLNTTAVQLQEMGTFHGVPLLSQVMEHIMTGEAVMWKNVKLTNSKVILISFLNSRMVPLLIYK